MMMDPLNVSFCPPALLLRYLFTRSLTVALVWFLLPDACQHWIWRLVGTPQEKYSRQEETMHKSPSKARNHHRRVSFGQLEILEFPSMLGDNPSVRVGAPLTLSWWPIRKSILQVDLLPDRRGPRSKPRALPAYERELLLLSKGYDFLEIEQASKRPCKLHQEPTNGSFLAFKRRFKSMAAYKVNRLRGMNGSLS